jgi:hypothetical protein
MGQADDMTFDREGRLLVLELDRKGVDDHR